MSTSHPLDNPVWWSLAGAHAHLAERQGRALRYRSDVSPFAAVPDVPDAADWADLAALLGPDTVPLTTGAVAAPPPGWQTMFSVDGVQMVDEGVAAAPDEEAVQLGPGDVPEMLDLVARTKPGPFLPRTVEMGTYLGIRRDGALAAMAGERLRPAGWTEISAVCTDPAYRGQGLATRLIHAIAAGIRARGETPFLHAAADNTTAIRLYASLGFRVRRSTPFIGARPLDGVPVS
ncbi:GNAT family N-acetyltransferase [Planosporangium thailandense]|uniref:GNAT family N-acetyltransferase n=1 Tax=Planosporangium thailandense TaxID=765197 RepID=A0ABX0Y2X2_9ACTN|nr:GNAT family N-acetyltransferase [Planosporangium thailandense]NJC72363.1 GNAT family N-acetyltransferase [Planosporangium thailandense]